MCTCSFLCIQCTCINLLAHLLCSILVIQCTSVILYGLCQYQSNIVFSMYTCSICVMFKPFAFSEACGLLLFVNNVS